MPVLQFSPYALPRNLCSLCLAPCDLQACTSWDVVQHVRLPIMSLITLPDFACALWLKHWRLMRHLFSIKKLFMNTVKLTVSYVDSSPLQKGERQDCVYCANERGKKREKWFVTFKPVRSTLTERLPHLSYDVNIIDSQKCVVLCG